MVPTGSAQLTDPAAADASPGALGAALPAHRCSAPSHCFMGANLERLKCYFIVVYFVSFASPYSLINEAVRLVALCVPLRTPLL